MENNNTDVSSFGSSNIFLCHISLSIGKSCKVILKLLAVMDQFYTNPAKSTVRLHNKWITKTTRQCFGIRIFEKHHRIRHPYSILCKSLISCNLTSCDLKLTQI